MIPEEKWGKDHKSLLLYIETVCVDDKGIPDKRRMRCNSNTHPQFFNSHFRGKDFDEDGKYLYSTYLKEGIEPEHDDWDCANDLVSAGLLEIVGYTLSPIFKLTEKGFNYAHKLRKDRADVPKPNSN